MYPKGTTHVYSYFEARKGATYNKTVFYGLQYLIKKHLIGSQVVTHDKIESAAELCKAHFGNESTFNRPMWEHILYNHGGRLPIHIMAVDEGTPVDVNNVMMTVVNTDPFCYPLTNHLETLLTHVWSGSTTATLSYEIKKLIDWYYQETCDNKDGLDFALHDFGLRGVSSMESAAVQGSGHLLSFLGTDNLVAMEMAMDYYDADLNSLAYSVPATEHSVMTSMGQEGEYKLLENLINEYPEGILSLVIDSYNYRDFIKVHTKKLKDKILARNGVTVFRPDSGDPESVTIEVLTDLDSVFGSTVNAKGYKILNPSVKMLWGDGIDYQGIRDILFTMKSNGWAASNIIFGCGGGLLQKVNRDTQRFAFKCSAQKRNGEWIDIYKNPLDSSKASKKGKLKLIRNVHGGFSTVGYDDQNNYDCLSTVFLNGELKKDLSFDQIRENINQ
jgi:nicotinamide phosphoribosyltransferase